MDRDIFLTTPYRYEAFPYREDGDLSVTVFASTNSNVKDVFYTITLCKSTGREVVRFLLTKKETEELRDGLNDWFNEEDK